MDNNHKNEKDAGDDEWLRECCKCGRR